MKHAEPEASITFSEAEEGNFQNSRGNREGKQKEEGGGSKTFR